MVRADRAYGSTGQVPGAPGPVPLTKMIDKVIEDNDDYDEYETDIIEDNMDDTDNDDLVQANDLSYKDIDDLAQPRQANNTNNVKANVDDGVDGVNERATEH